MIKEFKGDYRFLSNFHLIPQTATYTLDLDYAIPEALLKPSLNVLVVRDKVTISYPSNEHFFQANKASTWEEHLEIAAPSERYREIPPAATPGIAKRMGGKNGYKGFKIVPRPDWEDIKINIMRTGLSCKFRQNPDLAKLLIQTWEQNHELQEGNWWRDSFWGICFRSGKGSNWLGVLLMELRNNLIIEIPGRILGPLLG